MSGFLLDTSALSALRDNEPGSARVSQLLKDAHSDGLPCQCKIGHYASPPLASDTSLMNSRRGGTIIMREDRKLRHSGRDRRNPDFKDGAVSRMP